MPDQEKPDSDFDNLKDDSAPEATAAAFAAKVTEASGGPTLASGPDPVPVAEAPAAPAPRRVSRLAETPPPVIEMPESRLKTLTRRDFLLFGAGAVAVAAGFWWLLPEDTEARTLPGSWRARLDSLDMRVGALPAGADLSTLPAAERAYKLSSAAKDRFLNKVLTFDDDIAEALYSPDRSVPTYPRSLAIPDLKNNYDGQTPDPGYIDTWTLTLTGLASGRTLVLRMKDLLRFAQHDQVTRLVCVEGWSAIAWWGGLRFADLLRAYPPMPGARWAHMTSSVNLDSDGNSDPYYVSIDLPTAQHPQTLLATRYNGAPLDVGHGAPLRLVAPMKLGLKNIKAITHIDYVVNEPPDYWNQRGYSKYDGL
jgi:DMSO/TMAO reductase YedYZ molybdopterin-dependent catalytic subunit